MYQVADGLKLFERCGLHLAGAASVVILSVLLHAALFRAAAEAREVEMRRLAQIEAVIASEQETRAEYHQVREQESMLRSNIAHIRKRLPPRSDVNALLSELSALADVHSVNVLSVQPAQQEQGELAACQQVRFRLLGTYESLCRIIHDTRNLQSLVWITGVKMAAAGERNQLQPIELDAALLFAPESTAAGKISIDQAATGETFE